MKQPHFITLFVNLRRAWLVEQIGRGRFHVSQAAQARDDAPHDALKLWRANVGAIRKMDQGQAQSLIERSFEK